MHLGGFIDLHIFGKFCQKLVDFWPKTTFFSPIWQKMETQTSDKKENNSKSTDQIAPMYFLDFLEFVNQ